LKTRFAAFWAIEIPADFSSSDWRLPPKRSFFSVPWLWCTSIRLDTLLAPLVTVDPAIEVIERDIELPLIWNWLTLKIAAGTII
jgi:hypothetical protein